LRFFLDVWEGYNLSMRKTPHLDVRHSYIRVISEIGQSCIGKIREELAVFSGARPGDWKFDGLRYQRMRLGVAFDPVGFADLKLRGQVRACRIAGQHSEINRLRRLSSKGWISSAHRLMLSGLLSLTS
jgi:hypothetical protein